MVEKVNAVKVMVSNDDVSVMVDGVGNDCIELGHAQCLHLNAQDGHSVSRLLYCCPCYNISGHTHSTLFAFPVNVLAELAAETTESLFSGHRTSRRSRNICGSSPLKTTSFGRCSQRTRPAK